jgi:DNA-binding HxlR family transcriptional regulator
MISELLKHDEHLRILKALERRPLRFTEIQKSLKLNPAQVDRALKSLKRGQCILPRTIPGDKGPIIVAYALSRRGRAFLEAFESFLRDLLSKQEFDRSEVAGVLGLKR